MFRLFDLTPHASEAGACSREDRHPPPHPQWARGRAVALGRSLPVAIRLQCQTPIMPQWHPQQRLSRRRRLFCRITELAQASAFASLASPSFFRFFHDGAAQVPEGIGCYDTLYFPVFLCSACVEVLEFTVLLCCVRLEMLEFPVILCYKHF